MATKEQSSSKKVTESKSQQRLPDVDLDTQEYETVMAAESVQRFRDGHQPPLTPGHLLALQRKVGNTTVQRLIDRAKTGQDWEAFQFEESLRHQGGEAPSSTENVPQVQREGGDGAGGAGGGTSAPDSGSGGGSGSGQGTDPESSDGPVNPPAPGPPVKFGLAGTGVSFTLEKGEVAVGYEKSNDIISKKVGPIMVPLASGLGIVMSASLKGGLTGGGSVKGSIKETEPPGASPGVMQETASFDASLEFKLGITGELFFGLGAGVQAANIATGIAGSLEYSHKYKPRVSGYAIRYSYPEDGGQSAWDEWAGEITMEQNVRSEIVAQLKAVGRWHLLTESGDWFVVDIGNWPIYEIYSVGSTKYGMPDGDISTSLDEGVKFLGVPLAVTESGQGKPPWEFKGQSGSGPTSPDEGSGGAPGKGRQGGGGGYGPAAAGEISEGEDVISGGQGGGGAGGGSQEEGMLSG